MSTFDFRKNEDRFIALICQGVGDLICSIPILKSLREFSPSSKITGIFKSSVERDFFLEVGLVDEAIVLNQNKKKSIYELIKILILIRKVKANLFISATDINQNKAALLGYITGASKRFGESSNWFSKLLYTKAVAINKHEHKFLSNKKIAGLVSLPADQSILLNADKLDPYGLSQIIKIIKSKYIVIHPGSGEIESHKRLPTHVYVPLINELKKNDALEIYFVGGSSERGLCEEIIAKSSGVNLAGLLSLRQTAELVRKSMVVVGADSGIMHLAAAVGARAVTVFGPTNPLRTGAYGDEVKVIWNKLECAPCYPAKPKGCGNPRCMNSVDYKKLLVPILKIIDNY